MTREEIYDTQINPLMKQIIAICKEHDIPMVASFQYNDDRPNGEAMLCSTVILNQDESVAACDALHAARRAIYNGGHPPPLMLTTRDGAGNVVASEVILP